ncbi:MAG TPA: acyl-CoA dehydrogenase family protein [Ktedonobacteraceae bacterium]|jgi:alkylation response protein AidB-like acyl-CoA dehydrogenase|nr:acyl-CoA dehydrogenase family protein [Ktedonobacteraceae bacterium]HZU66999.1 acyl-CoA dehydrogenase family protein [Ktedonobacteraceae bacterium]
MTTTSNHTETGSVSPAAEGQNVTAAIADIVRRSEKAREELTKIAPALDINEDPKAGIQIAWQAEIHRLSLPVEYGGLSDGSFTFALEPLMECLINICAGESSVGQMILTQALHIRILFPNSGLSKGALKQVAASFMEGDTRLVGSAAQPGIKEPVTATPVEGGIVINGVKQFNTQSEGRGWAEVACVLILEDGTKKPMAALVPLDAPGVIQHHDWDNMGQRGTGSQTITYKNVFVPDGWHHQLDLAALGPVLGIGMLYHAVLIQGIGEGAYDAMLDYARTLNRPSVSAFTSARDDVFMQRLIGVNRGNLWAARALLLETARKAEHATPETDMMQLSARAMAAKAASVRAALQVCDQMFDVCGSRATANKYHLDRFWRNARTFACHDSTDAKDAIVGAIELTGQMPMTLLPRL